MNDPLEKLEEEHRVIEKVIGALKHMVEAMKRDVNPPVEDLRKSVDFLRTFADKCHHSKEEEVLFRVLEERGVPRSGGPIGVMLQEHEQGRSLIKEMLRAVEAIEKGNEHGYIVFSEKASSYIELLEDHISKEDNVLYPIGRNILGKKEMENLSEDFEKIEVEKVGTGVHEKYYRIAEELGVKYK
ncbi:MAG: hemerythrin domain-containing protein [Thermoproteota archaeon]